MKIVCLLLFFAVLFPQTLLAQQELELGEAKPEETTKLVSEKPYAGLALSVGIVVIVATIAVLLFFFSRRKRIPTFSFPLINLPTSAKSLISLLIGIFCLVHLFALSEVYLQSRIVWKSVEEYFFGMTLAKLVAISHAHLFGHAVMYTLVSAIFLLCHLSESIKVPIVSVTIAGGVWDVLSWWMIKYVSAGFEALSAIAGGMSALGFLTMVILIFRELWFRKTSQVP